MPSTPVIALQHSCSEFPIHLRHFQACLLYKSHLLSMEHHLCSTILTPSWHEIFPDSPAFKTFNMLTTVDIFNLFQHAVRTVLEEPPWLIPPVSIDLSLTQFTAEHPVELRNRSLELINSEFNNHIQIYTGRVKICFKVWMCVFCQSVRHNQAISFKYLLFYLFSGAICNIREHKLDQDNAVPEDRYLLKIH